MFLSDLYNRHSGKDIFVLGSGPSLGFIPPKFFNNKIVICVNNTISYIDKAKHLYLIAKEPTKTMQEVAMAKGADIVSCEYAFGEASLGKRNTFLFPEKTYLFEPKISCIRDKDQRTALEKSPSTIVSGIHLAAFLGASNVMLVGHDCGEIDGKVHLDGYDKRQAAVSSRDYRKWMRQFAVEYRTLRIKKTLSDVYGIGVLSVNPFINFNLEGHRYTGYLKIV